MKKMLQILDQIIQLNNYGVKARKGFKTSISMSSQGTCLLIDYCTKISRTETVYDIITSKTRSIINKEFMK